MRKSAIINQNIMLILGGIACALFVDAVSRLETKYAIVALIGALMLATTIFFKDNLRRFLLYLLVLSIPFLGIDKTFFLFDFLEEGIPYVGDPGVTLAPADILLMALYVLWLGEIFITRKSKFPRLSKTDLCVLGFIGAMVLSMVNAPRPTLSVFEIIRHIKMFLFYFYISRNVRREDVKYILVCLAIGVILESLIGAIQYSTGRLLGVGMKTSVEQGYEQYLGSAFEGYRRAEGTLSVPHALATWFGMLLPIFASLFFSSHLPAAIRRACGIVFLMGGATALLTFARGGLYGVLVGLAFVTLVYTCQGEWKVIKPVVILLLCMVPFVIMFRKPLLLRFVEAPSEIGLPGRWDFAQDALSLIKDNPIIGGGVNNYAINLMRKRNYNYLTIAHTVPLLFAAETGIIGLTFFLGFLLANFLKGLRLFRSDDPLIRSVAIGLCAGLTSFMADGLVNPVYLLSHILYLFWIVAGFIGALYRQEKAVLGTATGLS